MKYIARGLIGAFALFIGAFILHIIGGATDQGWLFAIAVGLIFILATGYPIVAGEIAGHYQRITSIIGFPVAVVLTTAALWAINDRSLAFWIFPLSPVLVLAVCMGLMRLDRSLRDKKPAPPEANA